MTENGCQQCGENTYSGAGASSCTSCPAGKISAAGSTSESDCFYGNKCWQKSTLFRLNQNRDQNAKMALIAYCNL